MQQKLSEIQLKEKEKNPNADPLENKEFLEIINNQIKKIQKEEENQEEEEFEEEEEESEEAEEETNDKEYIQDESNFYIPTEESIFNNDNNKKIINKEKLVNYLFYLKLSELEEMKEKISKKLNNIKTEVMKIVGDKSYEQIYNYYHSLSVCFKSFIVRIMRILTNLKK